MEPAPGPDFLSAESPIFRAFADKLSYLEAGDMARIEAAFVFASAAHAQQKRLSGEPYITHPVAVAEAVVEWRMDAEAIMAALLHDVLEDTRVSKQELSERFGSEVADLVDGLSKLDKIEFASYRDAQAENFRKMLMAMARDLRVVLIKLADRRHNIHTMAALRPDKRRRIASETLEVYAPIALRLGLNKLYRELQDTCFELIHPLRAGVLRKALLAASGNRRELLDKVLSSLSGKLKKEGIEAEVFGREKGLYSIYRKMKDRHLSFLQVLDIYGFRVVVERIPMCYLALGALHALYKPVPGKFKDYIALPKDNGYQSLHTTLIGPYGTPVEVQIRTREMHQVAQEGVAAHWLYKDGEAGSNGELEIRTHKWLQSLLETQSSDSAEFFENVKIDLFPDEVYVFTPRGKIMTLPSGATAIDFAYAVHTNIGNHCTAAHINHVLSPLATKLRNGDVVEIVTDPLAVPQASWLSVVKTGRARGKIRHYLRNIQNEESATLGKRMLYKELLAMGVLPVSVADLNWRQLVGHSGSASLHDLFTDIGLGKRVPAVVARLLLARETLPAPSGNSTLAIHGNEGMAIQLAKCCQPIPGDPIIGAIRKGHGLVVHARDCANISRSYLNEPGKWMEIEWAPEEGRLFQVSIQVDVKDKRGVLAQVAASISRSGSNIIHVATGESAEHVFSILNFTIDVADRSHLEQVIRALQRLPEVLRVSRASSKE